MVYDGPQIQARFEMLKTLLNDCLHPSEKYSNLSSVKDAVMPKDYILNLNVIGKGDSCVEHWLVNGVYYSYRQLCQIGNVTFTPIDEFETDEETNLTVTEHDSDNEFGDSDYHDIYDKI